MVAEPLASMRGHCPTVLPFQRLHVQLVYPSLKYPLPQNLKMRIHSNALMKLDQNRGPLGLAITWLFFALPAALPVNAQEINGTPGSPGATTTIDGTQLPPPDPKFGGVIKENAVQSKPWWAPRVVPPKQAPNILLIMTDDVGFGAPSTFGGVIPTPALDRIAKNGLRYISSTPLRSARPRARHSSPAAITTRRASVLS